MARKKSHSGVVRGEVTREKYSANVQLDSVQALNLVRHVAEALIYSEEVVIEPHWGRRGQDDLYRIDVWSA
jgi:hypothetical protein